MARPFLSKKSSRSITSKSSKSDNGSVYGGSTAAGVSGTMGGGGNRSGLSSSPSKTRKNNKPNKGDHLVPLSDEEDNAFTNENASTASGRYSNMMSSSNSSRNKNNNRGNEEDEDTYDEISSEKPTTNTYSSGYYNNKTKYNKNYKHDDDDTETETETRRTYDDDNSTEYSDSVQCNIQTVDCDCLFWDALWGGSGRNNKKKSSDRYDDDDETLSTMDYSSVGYSSGGGTNIREVGSVASGTIEESKKTKSKSNEDDEDEDETKEGKQAQQQGAIEESDSFYLADAEKFVNSVSQMLDSTVNFAVQIGRSPAGRCVSYTAKAAMDDPLCASPHDLAKIEERNRSRRASQGGPLSDLMEGIDEDFDDEGRFETTNQDEAQQQGVLTVASSRQSSTTSSKKNKSGKATAEAIPSYDSSTNALLMTKVSSVSDLVQQQKQKNSQSESRDTFDFEEGGAVTLGRTTSVAQSIKSTKSSRKAASLSPRKRVSSRLGKKASSSRDDGDLPDSYLRILAKMEEQRLRDAEEESSQYGGTSTAAAGAVGAISLIKTSSNLSKLKKNPSMVSTSGAGAAPPIPMQINAAPSTATAATTKSMKVQKTIGLPPRSPRKSMSTSFAGSLSPKKTSSSASKLSPMKSKSKGENEQQEPPSAKSSSSSSSLSAHHEVDEGAAADNDGGEQQARSVTKTNSSSSSSTGKSSSANSQTKNQLETISSSLLQQTPTNSTAGSEQSSIEVEVLQGARRRGSGSGGGLAKSLLKGKKIMMGEHKGVKKDGETTSDNHGYELFTKTESNMSALSQSYHPTPSNLKSNMSSTLAVSTVPEESIRRLGLSKSSTSSKSKGEAIQEESIVSKKSSASSSASSATTPKNAIATALGLFSSKKSKSNVSGGGASSSADEQREGAPEPTLSAQSGVGTSASSSGVSEYYYSSGGSSESSGGSQKDTEALLFAKAMANISKDTSKTNNLSSQSYIMKRKKSRNFAADQITIHEPTAE